MNIFTLITAYCFVVALIYGGMTMSQQKRKRIVILFLAPLLYIQTFKSAASLPDLQDYVEVYVKTGALSWSSLIKSGFDVDYSMEPGYIFLNKIISLINTNEHFLFFVIAAVTLVCYGLTIKRFCAFASLACLLYFFGPFSQSLYVLRQHLSIAVFLLALPYVIQRKPLKFILIAIISILLHYTSIVFLPLYFLYHVNDKKKLAILLIGGSLILKLLMMVILNYAVSIYGSYSVYLDEDGTNFKVPLLLLIAVIIRIFLTSDNYLREGENRLITILLCVGFVVSFAGMGFGPSARLFMGYTSLLWLTIPQTLSIINNARTRKMVGAFYVFASILMFRALFNYIENLELII